MFYDKKKYLLQKKQNINFYGYTYVKVRESAPSFVDNWTTPLNGLMYVQKLLRELSFVLRCSIYDKCISF